MPVKSRKVKVHCDQCEMLSTNGRKTWVVGRGWVRYVACHICDCDVELGEACDCQETELNEPRIHFFGEVAA
jgi:hypothetical protein